MNAIVLIFDERYAPHASVTIQTILDNGAGTVPWKLYVVTSNVATETLLKLKSQLDSCSISYILIDAQDWTAKLDAVGFPRYRGSHAASLKLFAPAFVDEDIERILYLDSDTLVMDSLDRIWSLDLGNAAIGMSQESLSQTCRLSLPGLAEDACYFNSGVMLIDARLYKERGLEGTILWAMRRIPSGSFAPDQDVLNAYLGDQITDIGPEYNLQPFHFAYSDEVFYSQYDTPLYYSVARIIEARSSPVIIHAYRFLGTFPWMRSHVHPFRRIFLQSKTRTPFADMPSVSAPGGLYAVERLLYLILPKRIFLAIWHELQKRHYTRIGSLNSNA